MSSPFMCISQIEKVRREESSSHENSRILLSLKGYFTYSRLMSTPTRTLVLRGR